MKTARVEFKRFSGGIINTRTRPKTASRIAFLGNGVVNDQVGVRS